MNFKNSISEIDTFDRNIDWLFDFTQDFENRKKWDKQTLEIDFIGDFTALKKGAKVYTKSLEGIYMETEYLTFDSPNEISIKMLNKSAVFSDFFGSWHYTSTDNGKTTLKITYSFNLRFPYSLIKHKVSQKIRMNMIKKLNMLKRHLIELEDKTVLEDSV